MNAKRFISVRLHALGHRSASDILFRLGIPLQLSYYVQQQSMNAAASAALNKNKTGWSRLDGFRIHFCFL